MGGASATNDTTTTATELPECTAADNAVSYLLCPSVIYDAAVEICDAGLSSLKDTCIEAAETALALPFDASTITDCQCPESSGTTIVAFSVMACLIGLFL